MTDRIPLVVLAAWLSEDAIARISQTLEPKKQAAQVDLELAEVGLVAGWKDSENGPVLAVLRLIPQAR